MCAGLCMMYTYMCVGLYMMYTIHIHVCRPVHDVHEEAVMMYLPLIHGSGNMLSIHVYMYLNICYYFG